MRFVAILPDGYDSTGSYPVLWLLHGYGGNDSMGEIERELQLRSDSGFPSASDTLRSVLS